MFPSKELPTADRDEAREVSATDRQPQQSNACWLAFAGEARSLRRFVQRDETGRSEAGRGARCSSSSPSASSSRVLTSSGPAKTKPAQNVCPE